MEQKHYEFCQKKYRGEIPDSWEELADKLGYKTGEYLRVMFKNERHKRGDVPQQKVDGETGNISTDYHEKTEIHGDGSITSDRLIEMMEEDSRSPERIMELHKFDPEKWKLISCRNNLWHMQKKGGARLLCYQSKITVIPKKEGGWSAKTIDRLFESLSDKKQILSAIPAPSKMHPNGKMLLVGISDFHFGLLSTDHSTGNEYNMRIAKSLYLDTIYQIVEEVRGKKFDEIVFLHGNDFINFNSTGQSTSNGTLQENDGIWFDVVNQAVELSLQGINAMIPLANRLKVIFVPSNHDLETMYGIMHTLRAYYHTCPNIEVDYSPLPYKYHQFGKCLFGFGHDLDKKRRLERFTVDAKELWSSSEHMYWMLAHLHQAIQYEREGYLETYRLPTLSGWSRWATNKGFSQTDRRTQCFIVDENVGITTTMNIVV